VREFIAIIATLAAFVVPVGIMILPILGLSEFAYAFDMIKTWLAFIGPMASLIIGFYFK
jgi:hypothetical protein